jgi:hypothetical protein
MITLVEGAARCHAPSIRTLISSACFVQLSWELMKSCFWGAIPLAKIPRIPDPQALPGLSLLPNRVRLPPAAAAAVVGWGAKIALLPTGLHPRPKEGCCGLLLPGSMLQFHPFRSPDVESAEVRAIRAMSVSNGQCSATRVEGPARA